MQGDRWIIFYTDGSTFNSVDGTPWDAPRIGVQCIATSKEKTEKDWYTIQQVEGYYYEKDRGGWLEFENDRTFWLHFMRAKYPCAVFGEMISDVEWRSCFERITKYCQKNSKWLIGLTNELSEKNYI